MKKAIALLIPALALAAAATSVAGDTEEHKKTCSAEATVCIREMAKGLKQRGWIGIEWNDSDERPTISHVVQGSPAAKAGVAVGDVVVAFDGTSTDEDDEVVWAAMKRSLLPGKTLTLSVVRDGAARDLAIELIAVPDHIVAQWVGKHVLDYHAAAEDGEVRGSP